MLLFVSGRSLLVTGGMDRLIRMWNPHFSGKPTGVLKGHSAPIIYLCISSEDSQIFSVSIDSTVKIWDLQDQCCLFTADPKASGIHGDISACSYSSAMKSLFIAADCMAVLSLKIRLVFCSRLTVSHNEPVMCCGYSEEFRQVVSCTEGSVVKVWDFDSGCQVFEFGGTPDLSAVTCMAFDLRGRRLITGGRDGCLKIWNFNNGQCLKTLKRDGECHEVCDCIFLKDIPEDLHHVQRPKPSWQDDLKNGHNEDILCVAQCPPTLLATGSYDGEIIVWNVVSGRIQCRFVSPRSAEHPNVEGPDTSVQSIIFLKNLQLQQFSSATALLSSGTTGQSLIQTFWSIHISSSWMHPAVPYEVLIHPLSMPDHEIWNVNTHLSDAVNPDKTEADSGELKVSWIVSQMII
uniref:WD repeat-containing protein 49-like n=1 Tax=Seriola lalandi dorsalis TaxID=1841481 RepID=A0A3B4WQR1_SERLL